MVQGTYSNSTNGTYARFNFDSNRAKWEVNENGNTRYFISYRHAVKVYERIVNRLEKAAQ